ncbi:putative membrane protein [Pseudomonas donghuensis]
MLGADFTFLECRMSRRLPLIALLVFLPLWLAASYGLRYVLMEDAHWLATCADQAQLWGCQARSVMGLMIHFRLLAWSALGLALLATLVPGRAGWRLGVAALVCGIPALVLYTASIAVFAVVLAGLRLVRRSS